MFIRQSTPKGTPTDVDILRLLKTVIIKEALIYKDSGTEQHY